MIERIWHDWQSFWFQPGEVRRIIYVRVAICLWAAIWFGSFLPNVGTWFGETGILDSSMASLMIDYEGYARWQLWSPLWFLPSTGGITVFLCTGIVVSLIAALGIGGRLSLAALLLFALSLTHRIVWLIGLAEPALVAFVAYLMVEPGPPLLSKLSRPRTSPWAQTTLRLLQTHWWILIAAGVLSQMADLIWWRGDAIWWLASAQRSVLLSPEWLYRHPLQANALTHGFVCIELLTLWLITIRSTRWIGITLGVIALAGIGLLADQLLYASLMLCPLIAYASDLGPEVATD